MKIVLIHTSYPYAEQMTTPPLGLLYLSAVLHERGHQVQILDRRIPGMTSEEVIARINECKPELVGFSTLTCETRDLNNLAAEVKKTSPQTMTVVGGPHASSQPEAALAEPGIDVAVIGEGELTIMELVSGKELSTIAGLAYRTKGVIELTEPRAAIEDLDALPHPAWDLIELDLYTRLQRFGMIAAGHPYAVMMTSRGCPYRCAYCHNIFGKVYRVHSPAWVEAEVATLTKRYGVRELQILDDTFNLNRGRTIHLAAVVARTAPQLKLAFPNGLRADLMDAEVVQALKSAGTYRINYAVETASPRLQLLIDKNLDLAKTKQVIARTARQGILTHGFFMLGFPTETLTELLRTFSYAYSSRLHGGVFVIVNPYPNTALYEYAQKSGLLQEGVSYESFEYLRSPLNLSTAPDWVLRLLQKLFNVLFYCSAPRVIGLIAALPEATSIRALLTLFMRRPFSHRTVEREPCQVDSEIKTRAQFMTRQTRSHYDNWPLDIPMHEPMVRYELERNLIGKFIVEVSGCKGVIVDLGCGCGRISNLIMQQGGDVIGLDLSGENVNAAHQRGITSLIGDCLNLPFKTGSAAAVVSYGVLHHTPSLVAALHELDRIAAPNAEIFLGINRAMSLNQLSYYVPGSLLRWLRRRGREDAVKAAYTLYRPFGLLFKLLQTRSLQPYPNLWRQFNDQFLSPNTSFHRAEEIARLARKLGWRLKVKRTSHAGGMWNYWFIKSSGSL